MKPVAISLFLCAFIALCHGVSQPVIRDTKAEGCIDGTCGPHCAWEEVKLFPFDTLNQPGKCRLLMCTKDFDIRMTPCSFDMTGEYEWVGQDNTKLYPECCGTMTKKH